MSKVNTHEISADVAVQAAVQLAQSMVQLDIAMGNQIDNIELHVMGLFRNALSELVGHGGGTATIEQIALSAP